MIDADTLWQIFDELILLGVDVSKIMYESTEMTPLHFAALKRCPLDVFKVLLDYGFDVNALIEESSSVMVYLAQDNNEAGYNPVLIRYLLLRGFNTSLLRYDGDYEFFFKIREEYLQVYRERLVAQ